MWNARLLYRTRYFLFRTKNVMLCEKCASIERQRLCHRVLSSQLYTYWSSWFSCMHWIYTIEWVCAILFDARYGIWRKMKPLTFWHFAFHIWMDICMVFRTQQIGAERFENKQQQDHQQTCDFYRSVVKIKSIINRGIGIFMWELKHINKRNILFWWQLNWTLRLMPSKPIFSKFGSKKYLMSSYEEKS